MMPEGNALRIMERMILQSSVLKIADSLITQKHAIIG
jgi:hypothetical protein